jgi:hypothetical protein
MRCLFSCIVGCGKKRREERDPLVRHLERYDLYGVLFYGKDQITQIYVYINIHI